MTVSVLIGDRAPDPFIAATHCLFLCRRHAKEWMAAPSVRLALVTLADHPNAAIANEAKRTLALVPGREG